MSGRYIAGLQHCFQSWQKPFNPILGETFQARLSDGSEVFLEQISHHPPISSFQLTGPGRISAFFVADVMPCQALALLTVRCTVWHLNAKSQDNLQRSYRTENIFLRAEKVLAVLVVYRMY